jgi:hypothetical protein
MRVPSPCPWCGGEGSIEVDLSGEEVWLACAMCFGAGSLADAVRAAERRGYLAALDDVQDVLRGRGPRAPQDTEVAQRW